MWNMMCDVMPTISEDTISQRSNQFSGEDANFEQLMVSMLDERDKLMDSLRETQERLADNETKLQETEKERDTLNRQIAANLPQVSAHGRRCRRRLRRPSRSVLIDTDREMTAIFDPQPAASALRKAVPSAAGRTAVSFVA
jgi:septal ring factor EnvC (AmiA/AmiB activator)